MKKLSELRGKLLIQKIFHRFMSNNYNMMKNYLLF